MGLTLNELEKRLQSLIEVHLVKYIPGQSHQQLVAQRLAEAIRSTLSTRTLEGEQTASHHQFLLIVHPSIISQWEKDPRLLEGLTKIFRLVISELGVRFSQSPTIALASDPTVPPSDVIVKIAQEDTVAQTQGMSEVENESPLRPAFLIIGGTKVFALSQAVTNIGRRLDNHLVVDDPRVSRYHAQLRFVRGRYVIFDLNSTGGTYVNGQRTNQSVLYPGDVVSLAGLPIVFGQDNPPPMMGVGDTSPISPAASERNTAVLRPIRPEDKK